MARVHDGPLSPHQQIEGILQRHGCPLPQAGQLLFSFPYRDRGNRQPNLLPYFPPCEQAAERQSKVRQYILTVLQRIVYT
jgi:hypothetical protein